MQCCVSLPKYTRREAEDVAPTCRRRLSEYKGQPYPEDAEFEVEMIVGERKRGKGSQEPRMVRLWFGRRHWDESAHLWQSC